MIQLGNVWGIARAEMRLTRRLVRYWVFVVLAGLLAAFSFAQFVVIHWLFSFASASAASAYPRYFMGSFGSNFVFIFLIGLVFLGFDIRARDTRERMTEVLDALPYSNVELVLGKYLGILIPSWVAAVVSVLIMAAVGAAIGASLEPKSLVMFMIFMIIPAYTFALGLVFFLTLLLRHRLLAFLATTAILVGAFFASIFFISMSNVPAIDVTGGYTMPFPSDMVGQVIQLPALIQRAGFFLMGVALLLFAATIHPRADDGSSAARAAGAFVVLLVGAALVLTQVVSFRSVVGRKQAWHAAHSEKKDVVAPDLLALTGEVRVEPARRIEMALNLRFKAPESAPLDTALFTLNPGFVVEEVRDEQGSPLEHSHESGLLSIRLQNALQPGMEAALDMKISGTPDPVFAYIDAALEPMNVKLSDAQIFILGFDPIVFHKRFVALLPGARWLPAPGSDIGRGDPMVRPYDFFDVDLTFDLPGGWLAAGPGRRQDAGGGDGRVRFRFAPGAPVPEVAFVAGPYESRAVEIEGVQLEALLHPKHSGTFETFEDASGEIRTWLGDKLREARELGLAYPYDGLTLVEVPNQLRGFAGGWRLDSAMIQPAMILMRESGFPTARFSYGFRNPDRFREQEGGLPRRKRQVLEAFFENDMNGGNPFIAATRSFFGFQTAASGPAGYSLDFVFENLSARLLTEKRGYFSVHMFDRNFGNNFAQAGQSMNDPDRIGETYADVLIHMLTSRPEIWDTILEVSLDKLRPWEDPKRTINVLSLKGNAMAQSLLDGLGREKTGKLIAAIRDARQGGTFTREDVVELGIDIEEDLGEWMQVWLEQTDLPGFTVADVQVERIPDSDEGAPRYQSILTVRNEEDVPGLLKIDYRIGDGRAAADRGSTDPVRVPGRGAVEIGLITAEAPRTLRVAPYLALNRDPFNVSLPGVDEERIVEREPFIGSRELEWVPEESLAIVVDDLDPGFSIEDSGEGSMMRVQGRGTDEGLDQGLPIASSPRRSAKWSRSTFPGAFGKYRHTAAVVKAGTGTRTAVFRADLGKSGRWALEYYLPQWPKRWDRGKNSRGNWTVTVSDASGDREALRFDTGSGAAGWNSIGEYELSDGEVRVVVSDETDASFVVADAIRWVPVEPQGDVVAAR